MHKHGTPLSRDQVLPVQHALQGHPESGALWERFVNKVLARHGFVSTTHERSLYKGSFNGYHMLISRQVDDLAIGCSNAASIRKLVTIICDEDKIDLRDEGILDSFNGVDVKQTRALYIFYFFIKLISRLPLLSYFCKDTHGYPTETIITYHDGRDSMGGMS
jgi:hypothetical protein